jgi:hypothetical protein
MKKINGNMQEAHYEHTTRYGEVVQRVPEFSTMSRNPGIGHAWFDRFNSDVFPSDHVVVNGKELKPPRYYDRCYEVICSPEELEMLKRKRIRRARKFRENCTPERLEVRRIVQEKRLETLKRRLG